MPYYETLKPKLERAISVIERALDIIEVARINKKPLSSRDVKYINNIDLVHELEVICLMLEAKAQKRNKKFLDQGSSEEYNPFILADLSDIDNFQKYLAGLPEDFKCHYDIILRPLDIHSSALQIHSDGNIARTFFLENYSDVNCKDRQKLEQAIGGTSHNYLEGKILNADYGCSIFAIQHLNKMSRLLNDKSEELYLQEGENSLENLRPSMLKHLQSGSLSKKYELTYRGQDLYIDKGRSITFRKHIDDFTVTSEVSDRYGNIEIKERNYSIMYKTEKYLVEALKTLEELHSREDSEREIERVLENRTGKNILNSVYQRMGLTHEQREYVQGLYNQDQINLALHFGISVESLETAKCFNTKKMSKAVFKYIEENPEQNAFNEIKNLSNLYQFYSVALYKLNQQDVEKSKFLTDANYALETFTFLQSWHSKSGDAGVQAAFETMKTFERYNPVEVRALKIVKALGENDANDFLNFSIETQNPSLIKLWLEAGADVNQAVKGKTPLVAALNTNDFEIISQIIAAGANIDLSAAQDKQEHLSLEKLILYLKKAIDQENPIAINNLVQFSPEILELEINGVLPFAYAIKENKLQLLGALFPASAFASPSRMEVENFDCNSPSKPPSKRSLEVALSSPTKGRRLNSL